MTRKEFLRVGTFEAEYQAVFENGLKADTISEETAAAGVTADGVLLKDGTVKTSQLIEKTANAGIKCADILFLPDPQTIDMDDAAVALVFGTAGAGEVQITSNILYVDANSGATEDLTLTPEATSKGLILWLVNTGGESIVVKDDGGSTVATVATAKRATFVCDGTTWEETSLVA